MKSPSPVPVSPVTHQAAPGRSADAWLQEVEHVLASGADVEFSPLGYSMWPALRPASDTVRVVPAPPCRVGDMVLARCADPAGVFLHRVVAVGPADAYVLMGDSNLYQREVCPASAIVARVVSVTRRGRDVTGSLSSTLLRRMALLSPAPRRLCVRLLSIILRRLHSSDKAHKPS